MLPATAWYRLLHCVEARGLTRTAALEYIKHGIRVNAVNPGLIHTQIAHDIVSGNEEVSRRAGETSAIARAGRPEEIASAVLWLCSPAASYVVKHALTVEGGLRPTAR